MKRTAGLLLALCTLAPATDRVDVYPGAVLDAAASRAASYGRKQSQVYTTNDGYDRVYAFYKGRYKENPYPLPPVTLPSGKPVRSAIFFVDGAQNLAVSKLWIRIQRPYIFTMNKGTGEFEDVRDVSVIQTVRREIKEKE